MARYTVNLSRAKSLSRRKRASKAMKILREELEDREGEDVSVDPGVNSHIWKDGIENPPRKIEVEVVETGDGLRAVMPGTEVEEPEPAPEPEAAEEETEEENEEAEEAEAEVEEQETEEGEETEDETGGETEVDYSEIVSGTVSEAKDAIEELDDPDYEAALGAEKDNKDRKTLKEWLESRM